MQQNNKNNLDPTKNSSFYNNKSPYRRTSAEIIHEAKSVLAGGKTQFFLSYRKSFQLGLLFFCLKAALGYCRLDAQLLHVNQLVSCTVKKMYQPDDHQVLSA
jgi:hypothetical protein